MAGGEDGEGLPQRRGGAEEGAWRGGPRGEGFAPLQGAEIIFDAFPRVGFVPQPTRGYRLQRRWR